MAQPKLFNAFMEGVFNATYDFDSSGYYWVLALAQPSLASVSYAEVDDVPSGNGYAGTIAVTVASSTRTGGVYSLVLDDAVLTASGGSIGPFRYLVLAAGTGPAVGYVDYGAEVTLADGQAFTIKGGTFLTATKNA